MEPLLNGFGTDVFNSETISTRLSFQQIFADRTSSYLNEYGSPREARIGLRQYLTHYNERRPHSSLAYQTPEVVYTQKG